jgi:eukaryotic-like serine/threonine-protein kinase
MAMNLRKTEWAGALDLLDRALDLPAEARGAWLASLGAEHLHLVPIVQRLLDERRAVETGQFLQSLPALPEAIRAKSGAFAMGQRIGPYALLRELGHGGMASVWLAERADGAHGREVALKLPYLGARAQVIGARFARERQILSALTHPNVASVLDAGADGAQPWLAMEYVEGLPITEWATQQGLDVRARLRIFLQVLEAVAHAHAQLVIHRDIKPSNVLVDTQGQVKLLDFGVAKLLGDDGAAHDTELTQLGGRAFTPQYASPEQINGQVLGAASDVYSLGVLLYELLTGRLPYAVQRTTPAALEDAILSARVAVPSSVVSDKPRQRALRGDIDTIVAKAMRLQPAERYGSVAALAGDIERHLHSLPIHALPDSLGYRLHKLWARQKLALGSAAAVLLSLLAGLGLALWQADGARKQAERAEAVLQFLVTTLQGNDPQQAQGRSLSARELLDLSAKRIDADFADRPDVRARLHHTVGAVYLSLGEPEPAKPHVEQALVLQESAGQTGSAAHLESLFALHEALIEMGDFAATAPVVERALALAEQYVGPRNRWAGRLLSSRGWIALRQGRVADAVRWSEQSLEAQREFNGELNNDYLKVAGSLSLVYMEAGEMTKARDVQTRIVEIGTKVSDHETIDKLVDVGNMARTDYSLGNHAAAERALAQMRPALERHVGKRHDRSIVFRSLHAQVLAELGRYDDAVREQTANLEEVRARGTPDDEQIALQAATLAKVLRSAGRIAEALPLAKEALAYFERKYPEPTWYRERVRWVFGELLMSGGRVSEGAGMVETALSALDKMLSAQPHHPVRPEGWLVLAVARRGEARAPDEASDALAARACIAFERAGMQGSPQQVRCQALLAWLVAVKPGASVDALAEFRTARERLLPLLPEAHALRAELVAAEAEIVGRDPARALQAQALWRQAHADYQSRLARPMPEPMAIVH